MQGRSEGTMKGFRGYVSRAQEGILSENPSAEEYDRVPGLETVRERASRHVLDRDELDTPAHMTVRTDPADSAATGPWADNEEDAESAAPATEHSDSELAGSEQADTRSADVSRHSVAPLHLAAAGQEAQKTCQWRRFFTPRILLAALCINLLLGGLFAVIMYLDRPAQPVYVYYIDLADRPADAGEPLDQTGPTEEAEETGQPKKGKPDAGPDREAGPAAEGVQPQALLAP